MDLINSVPQGPSSEECLLQSQGSRNAQAEAAAGRITSSVLCALRKVIPEGLSRVKAHHPRPCGKSG